MYARRDATAEVRAKYELNVTGLRDGRASNEAARSIQLDLRRQGRRPGKGA